jgi:hypothetical protein
LPVSEHQAETVEGPKMQRMIFRYKGKADKADENQEYIQKVFEELHRNSPSGLRYVSFKLNDGVSFVHIVSVETTEGNNPLTETPAFKLFNAGIKDRCEEQPVLAEMTEVGSYRFFGR